MSNKKNFRAIGLMSGTSLDGIDVALLESDGERVLEWGEATTVPFEDDLRAQLYELIQSKDPKLAEELERPFTLAHAEAVKAFGADGVDLIGFHGQTIDHQPHAGFTWQMGDGELLAQETGIDVVFDMRRNDICLGGQGAPLVPIFHRAIMADHQQPLAIVNIGGVSNVTYIDGDVIVAGDVGPGNAMMNDWVQKHLDRPFDNKGQLASQGRNYDDMIERCLNLPFFTQPLPKSLDRNAFKAWLYDNLSNLTIEDCCSTLCEITAQSIISSEKLMPSAPVQWIIAGGGRHNTELMKRLGEQASGKVMAIDELAIDGDALEAYAFAYLAIRSKLGLPLTMQQTTGVTRSWATGGVYARAS